MPPRVEESVSVVICTFADARWADLSAAMASIAAQATPAHQLILVVDHNEALLARAGATWPDALVVPNHYQRGLSGARNTGVGYADGSVVAFLDDDAMARPDWLYRLVAGYAEEEGVVAVGGAAVPVWPGGPPAWLPPEFWWVVGCSYVGLPVAAARVRNLLGCNMSFRRELFDIVGAFSTGVGRVGSRPVGCEETEFCIRVGRHQPGAIIRYDPAAVVDHRVGPSRVGWSYFSARCSAEGASKALVVASVGRRQALATERRYVTAVLPRALIRGMLDTASGDWHGALRAGAVVAGLGLTTAGYLRGRLQLLAERRAAVPVG